MTSKPKIDELLNQLDVEGEVEPRRIVAELVKRRAASQQAVIDAVATSPSCRIRRWCCEVLGGYKDSNLIPSLEAATRDGHMSVRLHALIAISDLKDDRAVAAVIRLLRDESGGIRGNAVVACRAYNDAFPDVLPALLAMIGDPKWYVRREVALSLIPSRSPAEMKAIATLTLDKHASVRKAAESRN